MLADGPDAQAEPGPEQDDVDQDEQHQRHVHDHVLLKRHLPEEWDLVESAGVDVRQPLGRPDMTDVLETVDAVGEEDGQPRGEDVDRDPADDLVGAELDRNDRVDGGHQRAGEHGDAGGKPGVVPGQVRHDGKERPGEHHAFHRDVHDAAALGDHAAERGQQKQHRSRERRLPQVGGEQQAEDVFETAHVGSGGGVVASDIRPAAGGSSGGKAAGALPKGRPLRIAPTKLAPMLNRITACRASTRLLEVPASLCMIAPPACSAPKSPEASMLPLRLPRPSWGTGVGPRPGLPVRYLSSGWWSTPRIWTAPARPVNAPAMSIWSLSVRRTLTPP